jgi:hypothetical protein
MCYAGAGQAYDSLLELAPLGVVVELVPEFSVLAESFFVSEGFSSDGFESAFDAPFDVPPLA